MWQRMGSMRVRVGFGMTYSEAIQFLYSLRWFGTKLGLTNTFKLAALARNPHLDLRFVHVAGTNGKGSTCAMLESIYRASGLRVGLFTSPHLISFRERLQMNRECITEHEVVGLVAEFQELLKQFPREEHPTFFEVVTVMALRYFQVKRCELVVWETGLGGRLDATNIVTPLASVITNIQLDHQQWLGEDLASIAAEKSGIIKPGVPVITATTEPDALTVIERVAASQKAPLTVVTDARLAEDFGQFQTALPGPYQRRNAAVALATVRVLSQRLPVTGEAIEAGLAKVKWPGRFQSIRLAGGREVLLDGAHNLAAAQALAGALRESGRGKVPVLVLGVLRDKDWTGICKVLAVLARKIFLVPVSSERSALPEDLEPMCRGANPAAEITLCASIREALEASAEESFVVVTGSLYLVGEALARLQGSDEACLDERSLNEWSNANGSAGKRQSPEK